MNKTADILPFPVGDARIRLKRGMVKLPTAANPARRVYPEWEELGRVRTLVARCLAGHILATPNENAILAATIYCKSCKAFFVV